MDRVKQSPALPLSPVTVGDDGPDKRHDLRNVFTDPSEDVRGKNLEITKQRQPLMLKQAHV